MRSPQGKKSHSGFTLIELLVALTILGGLMAVTYSGFRVALTMWEKGNERTEAFLELRTTLAILRDQLRGAIPIIVIQDEQPVQPKLAFDGQAASLRFVSRGSWRDGAHAVPRWIELTWNGRLVVQERQIIPPFNAARDSVLWRSEHDIFEDLQFQYLSRKTAERAAEWTDSWDIAVRRQLPAAIQLRYRVQQDWEVLLVPLDYAEANWQGYSFQ